MIYAALFISEMWCFDETADAPKLSVSLQTTLWLDRYQNTLQGIDGA